EVRLIDESMVRDEMERAVWSSLSKRSGDDAIVSSANLKRIRSDWSAARSALRDDLVDRGWFDPNAAQHRIPIYVGSAVLGLLSIVAFVFTVVGSQTWGFIGVALLAIPAVAGAIAISTYPDTTPTGIEAASGWHAYIEGIKRSKSDKTLDVNLDLDEAMPYAVAAGVTSSLDKRLKRASEKGYAPAWLGPTIHQYADGYNAYASWYAFHSTITPTSSSVSGAGSASAGGGGAGGSF